MFLLAQHTWVHLLFEIAISVLSVFLILLVLVQRGRGGGLAGALGGMGGQSAFGTRAGDTFTWITYGAALIWILLAGITIKTFTNPAADREAAAAKTNRSSTEDVESTDSNATTITTPATKSSPATKPSATKTNDDDFIPSVGGTGATEPPAKASAKDKPAVEEQPKAIETPAPETTPATPRPEGSEPVPPADAENAIPKTAEPTTDEESAADEPSNVVPE